MRAVRARWREGDVHDGHVEADDEQAHGADEQDPDSPVPAQLVDGHSSAGWPGGAGRVCCVFITITTVAVLSSRRQRPMIFGMALHRSSGRPVQAVRTPALAHSSQGPVPGASSPSSAVSPAISMASPLTDPCSCDGTASGAGRGTAEDRRTPNTTVASAPNAKSPATANTSSSEWTDAGAVAPGTSLPCPASELKMVTSTASPSAAPICWDTLTSPDAAPAIVGLHVGQRGRGERRRAPCRSRLRSGPARRTIWR